MVTVVITVLKWFLDSLMVRASACGKDVWGSNPSQGANFFKIKKS
jgi:hypothetical protein